MTGFVDGIYSRWHCDAISAITGQRCNKPAKLRWFRDSNVALCDECYALLKESEER